MKKGRNFRALAAAATLPHLGAVVAFGFGLMMGYGQSRAASPTTIFRFAGGHNGFEPLAGLIADSNGILYGTTSATDSRNHKVFGTVFSLTPPSGKAGQWTQSILWRFHDGNDGAHPASTLVMDSSGNLYGTTEYGNPGDTGTVFELSPPTGGDPNWTETIIHSFGGPGDGVGPYAGLVQAANGEMYGVTANGGANRKGVVFQLTPPAKGNGTWTESVLYSFTGDSTDGEFPEAALFLGSGGVLYGTTQYGGIDGSNCGAGGNSGCGTVFSLVPPANGQTQWTESILHFFTGGADGSAPRGNVIADGSGNLFGTTSSGGISSEGPCLNNPFCGVVFELSPPANGGSVWSESTLHTFAGGTDGQFPVAGLTRSSNGTLYGTTGNGGTFGNGTVFGLAPSNGGSTTWSETILHNFGEGNDWSFPLGNVLQDANGYLYGTTYKGGRSGNFGTVFRIEP